MDWKERVYNSIPTGRKNAVHSIEIQKRTGLTAREIRRMMENLRRSGMCICSSSSGYYLPETEEELIRYIRTEERIMKSKRITLKTAKAELKRMQNADQMAIQDIREGA